ncbi:hypothetical protein KAU19_03400 [Candidatus Parcubacteria bacterium]|nr:hypothetical protein [Candidatus Parcubacteria bacterium]
MILSIAKELFYTLTGTILIFVIMELLWTGIVLAYININWVLIFWLIVGIVILVVENRKQKTESR